MSHPAPKLGSDFLRNSRATPPELYELLDREFGPFDLDPCPLDENGTAGASLWGKDGTLISWKRRRVFCNPPYNDIPAFLAKAHEAAVAVYLLPVRSDLDWWHDVVMRDAAEVRFIRRRLRFSGKSGGAPFASVVVVFTDCPTDPVEGPRYRSMDRPERRP